LFGFLAFFSPDTFVLHLGPRWGTRGLYEEARELWENELLPSTEGAEPAYSGLHKPLDDLAAQLVTNIKTNVRERVDQHVARYISVVRLFPLLLLLHLSYT